MRPYEQKYLNECYDAMQYEHDACGIGLVVNIDGKKEYRTLDDALSIVEKLEHRAGKDATGEVGDGVGILVQISHKFFKKAAKEADIEVKDEGDYGVGMFFFPQDTKKRILAMRMFKVISEKNGLNIIGWREVPTNPDILGKVCGNLSPADDVKAVLLGDYLEHAHCTYALLCIQIGRAHV